MIRRRRLLSLVTIGAAVAMAAAGCVSSGGGGGGGAPASQGWAAATSLQAGGGMDALVADASREGTLNVIALPPDWANYGNILKAFTTKYGIKINSANPDGSSQDEINAVKQLGTQDRAPDVLDLGQSFANTNTALFAPYKVATWDTIPAANKDPNGAWVNDYGGYISIGCNNKIVPNCPTTFADLLKPEYKGQVALNGDPTQAAAAFAGRMGGGAGQRRQPRQHPARHRLLGQGLQGGQPAEGRPQLGHDRERPDADRARLGLPQRHPGREGEGVVRRGRSPFPRTACSPSTTLRRSTRTRRTRPRPGCGRSSCTPTRARTSGLQGKSRPVRLNAMQQAGTADKAGLAALPQVTGEPQFPTQAQTDAAQQAVAKGWAAATA